MSLRLLPGRWRNPRRGQGLVEYALILVLVAVVVVLVLSLMGRHIQSAFQDIADIMQGP